MENMVLVTNTILFTKFIIVKRGAYKKENLNDACKTSRDIQWIDGKTSSVNVFFSKGPQWKDGARQCG